jgi:ABC-type antimicrobial peptide transport system permease subunit
LLSHNVDPQALPGKFNAVFLSEAKSQLSKKNGNPPQASRSYGLQPITDLHLNRTGLKPEDEGRNSTGVSGGTLRYSVILTGIAVFVLVMAAVNFVNLAVAGSFRRTKEIAVRKITGSDRSAIIRQFIFEAALICVAAFMLAIILSYSVLPLFNSFVEKHLSFTQLIDVPLLLCWTAVILITTLLAGTYPALMLSKFKPVAVLSGKFKLTKGHWLGKTLVIFQFVIATCLLVATITYYRQMHFIAAKDLGYDAHNVVRFFIPMEKAGEDVPRLKHEIAMQRFVSGVTTASDNNVAVLGGFPTIVNDREVSYVNTAIDTSFLSVMNIPLVMGRNFSEAYSTDESAAAIVNESFIKAAGLQDPLGAQFRNTWGAGELRTIVGVVKDYHFSSLKDKIYPQVMLMTNDLPYFWVRIQNGREQEAVESLSALSKKYAPEYPFEFSFLEDEINLLYQPDKRWQQIISYATLLSFFICSIGLFGLAHLAASERTREIGVRKVLGASVSSIVSMLCKDVVKLLLIAQLIAFPIAWFVMIEWLQNYAYRIQPGWVIFFAAACVGMLISLITISYHSIKAASANPVKSLRTE